MPSFSQASKEKLSTCHPDLQKLFEAVIVHYDCTVICGHRGEADQNKAVAEGKSKTKWPNSKHNSVPSKAVDVMPTPINWSMDSKNIKSLYFFAGFVMATAKSLGIKLRWGGDFNRNQIFIDDVFVDIPHFELED